MAAPGLCLGVKNKPKFIHEKIRAAMKTASVRAFALLPVWILFCCCLLQAQTPFERTGQVFLVSQNTYDLLNFVVAPGNNVVQTSPFSPPPAGGIDAIGFRKTDNFIYGINPLDQHIYRIGKNGVSADVGGAGLNPGLYYQAGDVTPDGNYLVSIGADASSTDVHLAKTDLTGPVPVTEFVPLSSGYNLIDVAFDPNGGKLYGFDVFSHAFVTVNINTGTITPFAPIGSGNNVFGLYFDAFGDLYAYGFTLSGIVDALFIIDRNTGKEKRLATGPITEVLDAASCPYSVEMKCTVTPEIVLPCSDVVYSYLIANGSGETMMNAGFDHPLPAGFHFANFLLDPFNAPIDTLSQPGVMRLHDLTLPPGKQSFSIKVSAGDVPKGPRNSQSALTQLPALYGVKSRSDNPREPGFEDSTKLTINRFAEDSLFFNWLICNGETIQLDATPYGGSVQWSTGGTSPMLPVSKGGMYTLTAGTTCEQIVVSNMVTSSTCPFTIELSLLFSPDTIFPCDDVVMRFIIDNSSGEPRYNVSLVDTLPAGFTIIDILNNPFGGGLLTGLPPGLLHFDGLKLPVGTDTLDVLVETGDILPGIIKSRAKLYDLPLVMGPERLSDDPSTVLFDSSALVVQGTLSDTMYVEAIICGNARTTLDASALGKNLVWDDGSTDPKRVVEQEGEYRLTVLDGCEPSLVYWNVVQGPPIAIVPGDTIRMHQGEQVVLEPAIFSQGDTLALEWIDPPGQSLSCLYCPMPLATPLSSTLYSIKAFNGVCADSAGLMVAVDRSRRIFVPNVFSPNDDGNNDFFYLQSPDAGNIRTLAVYDRWGNAVYLSGTSVFNDVSGGWDGNNRGKPAPSGVYLWWAEIEFPDGEKKQLSGDVTLLR